GGLAAALAAAIFYGFGSILQAMAAADSTVTEHLDVAGLARLIAQWRYVAGLAFDLVGFFAAVVALRLLPLFVVQAAVASSVGVPLLYAIVAYGALATLLYAGALQRSPVTTVAAVTFSVETVLPAAVGLAVLGDRARAGMAPVAGVGFTLTVLASIALARFAEPPSAGRTQDRRVSRGG